MRFCLLQERQGWKENRSIKLTLLCQEALSCQFLKLIKSNSGSLVLQLCSSFGCFVSNPQVTFTGLKPAPGQPNPGISQSKCGIRRVLKLPSKMTGISFVRKHSPANFSLCNSLTDNIIVYLLRTKETNSVQAALQNATQRGKNRDALHSLTGYTSVILFA